MKRWSQMQTFGSEIRVNGARVIRQPVDREGLVSGDRRELRWTKDLEGSAFGPTRR